ncbi:MAG: sigma-54-dependent transcriptional regulator [Candidatus Binatia bacterium]
MSSTPSPAPPGLLVVDDEPNTLTLISQLFRREFPVCTAESGAAALDILAREPIGVVIADQRMPVMTGTELLTHVMERQPDVVRIILTAYADIDTLMHAINTGKVYQYITKPWENRDLTMIVRSAMDTFTLRQRNARLLQENTRLVEELRQANADLERENVSLKREVRGTYQLDNVIGVSPAMKQVLRLVEKAIDSSVTVLIAGETGTGKEVIARAIHYNGARRARKFVAQNCGSLPEALLESELFGHTRGAFTGAIRDHRGLFEEAHGGTIFLDEIGDMPLSMQVKLLRVLEEGEIRRVGSNEPVRVDVRVISATHKNLKEEVQAGRFRQDLYYRLDVFRVRLPPLRERDGDIALLARHFFEKYNQRSGKRLHGLTPAALEALQSHSFPGNVRELENEIERAVALANRGEHIDVDLLSHEMTGNDEIRAQANGSGALRQRLREVERRLIIQELNRNNQNRTRSAEKLGISVRALQKKIIWLGIKHN